MSVHSAKDIIRAARIKAGLTQEQLSEGICTLQSLSRIETGAADVGPATFQALMEHAGSPHGRYPVFSSREDFDCFYSLKHARFHLDAWQLTSAYEELQQIEDKGWADNRLYYQEWLLLHCRLQFRSYCCSHQQNYQALVYALHITRPRMDLSSFSGLLLSQNELQILISLSQEALYLGNIGTYLEIHAQLASYLASSKFAAMDKERMEAENAIVTVKYLIGRKEYETALEIADFHRHRMAVNIDTTFLMELTFLAGLCCYYTRQSSLSEKYIKAAFYSAHVTESCYATVCRNYLTQHTDFQLSRGMSRLPDIPLREYSRKTPPTQMSLSEGLYDTAISSSYTLGHIIRDLRSEQKITQTMLCQGLCSKSTLSKIENDTLQPDIALVETLLQRLGLSERIFVFWGNEKEVKLHDLKFRIIHNQALPKEITCSYLEEMKQLLGPEDKLYIQEYLMNKAMQQESAQERIAGLTEALMITLPDFDIHEIKRYRLSWKELSILNNMAHEYRRTSESHLSSFYFLQILAYVKAAKPDILLQNNFLPLTNYMYCHSLYTQKLYKDIISIPTYICTSIMNYNINALGTYLFFYSQALGEFSYTTEAIPAATYSCAINTLMELFKNASVLEKYLLDDFSIKLDY